jgi:hypothetical protein
LIRCRSFLHQGKSFDAVLELGVVVAGV